MFFKYVEGGVYLSLGKFRVTETSIIVFELGFGSATTVVFTI